MKKLRTRSDVRAIVLPVKFDKQIFLRLIQKYKPAVILGLGQCPRGGKIRIERRAINLKRNSKKEKGGLIETGGPKYRFVNLKLTPDDVSRASYSAGTYVCNFSMYTILGVAEKNKTTFAFLHVPRDFNIHETLAFIESKINIIFPCQIN